MDGRPSRAPWGGRTRGSGDERYAALPPEEPDEEELDEEPEDDEPEEDEDPDEEVPEVEAPEPLAEPLAELLEDESLEVPDVVDPDFAGVDPLVEDDLDRESVR